jgi:small-conductance mechanosensitive channel
MDKESLLGQLDTLWNFFTTPIFSLNNNAISIASFIAAFVIFAFFIIISKWVENLVAKALEKRTIDPGIKGSLERFSRYLTIAIGGFITLDSLGVSLNSLAALGAVLMVGIGFGLQNIAQNFISGLIILLERPIKRGDIVQVGDTSGRVMDIRVRSTVVETRDDVTIIIPNSQFITEQVINDSYSAEKIRYAVKIGVAYGSDVEKVKTTLLRIAEEHEAVRSHPAAKVFFMDFGSSSLDFELRVWVTEFWATDGILSDLRFAIDQEFRKQGIEIPFPQRDVHIKSQPGNLQVLPA